MGLLNQGSKIVTDCLFIEVISCNKQKILNKNFNSPKMRVCVCLIVANNNKYEENHTATLKCYKSS